MSRRDRRRQIMDAAERLFTSRRFHEVTTDEIAREAKVGKGTMYRYFTDKDDIFVQTAAAGFDDLCERIKANVPGSASFKEQLVAACAEIGAFFQRRHQLFRMAQAEDGHMSLFKGQLHEHWQKKRRELISALAGIIDRGVAEGVVRRDVSAEILANFLLGMLKTRGRDMAGFPAAARQYETVIDLFTNGAGRAAERPRAPRRAGPSARGKKTHSTTVHRRFS